MSWKRRLSLSLVVAATAGLLAATVQAQVGKSLGVKDVNVATEQELSAMPGMTPAIVQGLMDKRPFASLTDLNAYLLSQGLTQAQAMEFYQHAIVHVNLNTGTREEIVLIPGAGTRMAREFDEYRPWRNWTQFDREIGKYVGQEATDKLKQYVFIPMNANTASDEDLMTIPGMTPDLLARVKQGRPYTSEQQFKDSVGADAARVWRFLVM